MVYIICLELNEVSKMEYTDLCFILEHTDLCFILEDTLNIFHCYRLL